MKMSVMIMAKAAAGPAACEEGQVTAYTVGDTTYGAADDSQCVQMCASKAGLQWMAGVKEGACADEGFGTMVEAKEVQPAGSPVKMGVTIMAKGGAAAPVSPNCHCHSYEEIKCDASGQDLYDEHIDEINEHCKGIVDGTDDACPYKCFQPFEVLHLNYLECDTRPKDALYLKIKATKKCHKAAKPAYGKASECPEVVLEEEDHHEDHETHDHAEDGDHHGEEKHGTTTSAPASVDDTAKNDDADGETANAMAMAPKSFLAVALLFLANFLVLG